MTFKITHVDMDGYNGRDFHPEKSDEGTIVTPIAMTSMASDAEGNEYPMHNGAGDFHPRMALSSEGERSVVSEMDGLEETIIRCWRCATRDGRVIDLMEHEIEIHES